MDYRNRKYFFCDIQYDPDGYKALKNLKCIMSGPYNHFKDNQGWDSRYIHKYRYINQMISVPIENTESFIKEFERYGIIVCEATKELLGQ